MMCEQYQAWHATYGETFGYFEGPTPVLVTSNADILHQVFIKQFNNFHARKLWPVQVDPDQSEEVHLFFARGQRWKRLRSVVNPAFTASKLRKMEPQMNQSADRLIEVLDEAAEKSDEKRVELCGLFRRLTLNVIVGCALGIEQDAIRDPNNGFLKHCQGVIDDTTEQPVLYLFGFIFPTLNKLWMFLYKFMHNIKFNPVYWLEDRMKEYLNYRKKTDETYDDLLQQMLDARIPDKSFHDLDIEVKTGDEPQLDINGNLKKSTFKSLTESEVVAHSLLFLLAGYETSSTTLAYIFYELATNPHVQHALRKEIMEAMPEGEEPSYNNIKDLKYMDMVINETLRKYPLASTVIARQCQDTCQVEGLTIPSGMLVQANVWALHRDPKHWGTDPEAFDPTRFSPENKAERHGMSWMPFGAGPRMCVGLRFAVVQMKITMCKLLRQYAFHPASDLHSPLQLKEGATILPKHGVPLRAVRIP
ncbi:putative cytochrome P450 CYP13A4 [Littorina saxatilis]